MRDFFYIRVFHSLKLCLVEVGEDRRLLVKLHSKFKPIKSWYHENLMTIEVATVDGVSILTVWFHLVKDLR